VSSFKDYTLFCGDFQINLGANFKDIVNSELNPYFEDTIADKLGEYAIKVIYKNEIVGEYYADIFVERKVIVEIKVDDKYNSQHEAQLLNYLKATGIKIGLVINFGKSKCEFKRLIF